MSPEDPPLPGDQARAEIVVHVARAEAFRVFTEEIDQWWNHGRAFRASGRHPSVLAIEPGVGGRLFETYEVRGAKRVLESGRVTIWEPPARIVFTWRNTNFAPHEHTEVEIEFDAMGDARTRVRVTHRGWRSIRPDHPARHGHPPRVFVAKMGLRWAELLRGLRRHAG